MGKNKPEKLSYIDSIQQLVDLANERGVRVSDIVVEIESNRVRQEGSALIEKMASHYEIMRKSIEDGMACKFDFKTGLQNDIADITKDYYDNNKTISGGNIGKVVVYTMAVSGYNANMGHIIAAPTAGSCAIMPAVLKICEDNGYDNDKIVMSMFTAAGFADLIAQHCTFAGAGGGCMAECGSASAMASSAMVEIMGGTPEQASHAFALTLSSVLGLVCDSIAGYVEVPCMNKNIQGSINAIVFAEMALAGVKSVVPADEVIIAMKDVADNMDERFRETSQGALATTPTGCAISKKLLG